MNRRRFLETMLCGLGAAVAVRKFPFSVYSFPKDITIRNGLTAEQLGMLQLEAVAAQLPNSVEQTYYIHPNQMAELRKLGIVTPVSMRTFRVKGVDLHMGRGSEVRYAGLRVIENPFVLDLPRLYPRYSEKWNYYGPGSISFRRARSTARSSPESV